jgi:Tfp pilus assembly protein PilO
MTGYLDRLNLRPFEKRLVVGVGAIFFMVLNAWFVFPHFSDLSEAKERRAEALKKLESWQVEIDQKGKYEAGIKKFMKQGQEVLPEDQRDQFARAIQNQQVQSGVGIQNFGRTTVRTNQFFLELTQLISVESGEAQLVDFLYNLGSGNSLIRVSDLALKPNAVRQALSGNVKLVASYQKNPPKKTGPATKPSASSAKMVTSTVK